MLIKKLQLLLVILFISPLASASHSVGGLDMCALYPEVMPPGLPTEHIPDIGSQPAQLMQTYCTQCHELPGPGRHTAEEWPLVLQRMLTLMDVANRFGGLMGNIKKPNHEESELLQQYLTRYALKPLEQKTGGLGATAFENHCSACHALPDPQQYNNDNLPVLLKRMQRNMMVMKYAPPSFEVMLQIQQYLQSTPSPDSRPLKTTNLFNEAALNKKPLIYFESWLALGPFLLLVIIGLVRWKMNSGKTNNRKMQA